jgi:hypothetical protein
MSIEFPCPGCQKTLRVADEHAGKQARCPQCQTIASVPSAVQDGGLGGLGGSAPTSAFSQPAAPAPTTAAGDQGGQWRLRIDDGREFGPVDRKELDQWMSEGRVTPTSQLRREGESTWRPATEIYPALAAVASGGTAFAAAAPSPFGDAAKANPFSDQQPFQTNNPYAAPAGFAYTGQMYSKPHRGNQILIYGILGFLCCFLFGIAAWSMGAADLREMRSGIMDPSGRGTTQAGMIIGIVSTVLGIISVVFNVIILASQGGNF